MVWLRLGQALFFLTILYTIGLIVVFIIEGWHPVALKALIAIPIAFGFSNRMVTWGRQDIAKKAAASVQQLLNDALEKQG